MSARTSSNPAREPQALSRWTTQSLLFLAAALITNSHLELFYPVAQLAGDGLLGNALFFMVAGMGITLSAQAKRQPFASYYWRRIRRIYPTVFVVVTLFSVGLAGMWREWSWIDAVAAYIYPTEWPFIACVMVYYAIFYLLLQRPRFAVFATPLLLAALPFSYFWSIHPQGGTLMLGSLHNSIYWIFWFQCMLLGGCLVARAHSPNALARDLISFVAVFALYVALKYMFVTGRLAAFHYTLFPLVLLMLYLLFRIGNSTANIAFPGRFPRAAKCARWIASRTLEIYTVQGFLAYRRELVQALPFPLNIGLFLGLLLAAVWLVHRLVTLIPRERDNSPAMA